MSPGPSDEMAGDAPEPSGAEGDAPEADDAEGDEAEGDEAEGDDAVTEDDLHAALEEADEDGGAFEEGYEEGYGAGYERGYKEAILGRADGLTCVHNLPSLTGLCEH